jgi:cytoskeletal protein RodZ
MDCKDISTKLSEYIDETLELRQKADLEDHLGSCPACRKELEQTRLAVQMTRTSLKLKAPADFLERLHNKLERPAKSFAPRFNFGWGIAGVVLSLLLVFTVRDRITQFDQLHRDAALIDQKQPAMPVKSEVQKLSPASDMKISEKPKEITSYNAPSTPIPADKDIAKSADRVHQTQATAEKKVSAPATLQSAPLLKRPQIDHSRTEETEQYNEVSPAVGAGVVSNSVQDASSSGNFKAAGIEKEAALKLKEGIVRKGDSANLSSLYTTGQSDSLIENKTTSAQSAEDRISTAIKEVGGQIIITKINESTKKTQLIIVEIPPSKEPVFMQRISKIGKFRTETYLQKTGNLRINIHFPAAK